MCLGAEGRFCHGQLWCSAAVVTPGRLLYQEVLFGAVRELLILALLLVLLDGGVGSYGAYSPLLTTMLAMPLDGGAL